MSRTVFVGGNWKSNGTLASVNELASSLTSVEVPANTEVIIAPMAIHLETVKRVLDNSSIQVAAQNASQTGEGAFTGEISAKTIKDFGINWVILGHSERRQLYGDNNQIVADKIAKCLREDLSVIACVGETLEERKTDQTAKVVSQQLSAIAEQVESWNKIVIAYEPVWAIGTGLSATPEQAQQVHKIIRLFISEQISTQVAASIQIIYGGSVKPNNCVELIKENDIDGFLVGGASLKADLFAPIINAAVDAGM